MARKNPLGTIKDAAIGTILQPKAAAEKAVGTVVEGAKGGVGLGKAVAGQVASKATDTVTSLLPGRKATPADQAPDLEPAEPAATPRKSQGDPMATRNAPAKSAKATKTPKAAPKVTVSPDKPVNVTKELGLDPTPVAAPAAVVQAVEPEPVTSIDAAADASAVDVTPADIAPVVAKAPAKKAVAKKSPAKKAPAKKAAAKKAAAKKAAAASPGDKLPPPTS